MNKIKTYLILFGGVFALSTSAIWVRVAAGPSGVTAFYRLAITAVIDERYKANLPLIITTNLTPKQMRNAQDVAHARIYSRVLEMCTPILLQGADRRKSISNGKRVLAKQILFPQKEVPPNDKTE